MSVRMELPVLESSILEIAFGAIKRHLGLYKLSFLFGYITIELKML